MYKSQPFRLSALLIVAIALSACASTPIADPFEDLPTPVAGVPAEGTFTTTASPVITANGLKVANTTLKATANLEESADGVISGHVTVTGLDGKDYPVLVSGTNSGGKITVPVEVYLCDAEMTLTLYGTIAKDGTITVAGDGRDLSCFGQSVSIDVPQFTIATGANQ